MEIRKITDEHYVANISTADYDEIVAIINDISLGRSKEFELGTSNLLFDTILARRIGAELLNRDISLVTEGFIVVDAVLGDNVISVSIGEVSMNGNRQMLTGVLYK